jgi:hypothetical protein
MHSDPLDRFAAALSRALARFAGPERPPPRVDIDAARMALQRELSYRGRHYAIEDGRLVSDEGDVVTIEPTGSQVFCVRHRGRRFYALLKSVPYVAGRIAE